MTAITIPGQFRVLAAMAAVCLRVGDWLVGGFIFSLRGGSRFVIVGELSALGQDFLGYWA